MVQSLRLRISDLGFRLLRLPKVTGHSGGLSEERVDPTFLQLLNRGEVHGPEVGV